MAEWLSEGVVESARGDQKGIREGGGNGTYIPPTPQEV